MRARNTSNKESLQLYSTKKCRKVSEVVAQTSLEILNRRSGPTLRLVKRKENSVKVTLLTPTSLLCYLYYEGLAKS